MGKSFYRGEIMKIKVTHFNDSVTVYNRVLEYKISDGFLMIVFDNKENIYISNRQVMEFKIMK